MKNLFLLFVILLPLLVSAQNKKATSLTQNAKMANDAGELENAHTLFNEASEIYKTEEDWQNYLDCGVSITNILIQVGEYDMGVEACESFITKANEVNFSDLSLSLLYKNLGKIYYINDDYKSALPYLDKAKEVRETLNPVDPELARDYGNLGIISRFSERYNKATEYLSIALKLQKDQNVLARLYTEAGTNFKLTGNYRKSLDNLNQAIRILEKGEDALALANAYFEKGATLLELKQENTDLKFIEKALEIFIAEADYVNVVNCYNQIATSYFEFAPVSTRLRGGLDSAQLYYEKALETANSKLLPGNPYVAQIFLNLSAVLAKKNNFEDAGNYLTRSIELTKDIIDPKSIEKATIFAVQSNYNLLQGNYEAALKNYQSQLISLIKDYNNSDVNDLPTLELSKSSFSDSELQNALASKARCWYQFYKYGGKDKAKLEEALKSIRLFDELINHMRADFSGSGSNIAWSDITLDAYENAIEICLALEKETADVNYKSQALFYSEKSKGLSLLETFQNTKAKEVAGLSEKDLIMEREMKLDIADLEQKVFLMSQEMNPENEAEINILNKEIFSKKEAFERFLKDLESNNPEYYNTKYNLDILDLEQMRGLLKDNQCFVEYFVGDSSVFAFKITKTDFESFTLYGQESMMARVGDLRKSIYGYFLTNKDRSNQMKSKYAQQFTDRSFKMYQKLVEPLGDLPEKLIIIPAGAMCDMPFETLLMNKVDDPEKYKTHPYLIKKHVISYTYSATLLKEMINKKLEETEGVYLGFAPSFGESAASVVRGKRYSLSPLAFNKPEIVKVNQMLGTGTVFDGADATEAQFKELASDYQIIHFATHGMANSKDPDYSLLAFTTINDSIENEFLYVGDMYNLKLNSEMIVLSACETALGKNFRGEGIMSLARGFSYAGAKSVFTTLWCVNDHSTFEIIKGFYGHLQSGMDKDKALQQSKLDFLEKSSDFAAHPFLWSPYIIIGDAGSISSITKGIQWMYIAGAALVLVILGFLGMRAKNRKTA